jgi:hypothetical protein
MKYDRVAPKSAALIVRSFPPVIVAGNEFDLMEIGSMSHAARRISVLRLSIGLFALICLTAVWGFPPRSVVPDWPHSLASTPVHAALNAGPRLPDGAGLDASAWAAADSALSAIETTIGQLRESDETALNEPLLGMRRDELEFRTAPDPRYARQLSWWADMFSARLAERTIPEGTRTALAFKLAAFQRDALSLMQATPMQATLIQATTTGRHETVTSGDAVPPATPAIQPAT